MALGNNIKSTGDQQNTFKQDSFEETDTPAQDQESSDLSLYCVFVVNGEKYTIPMDYVKEVVKMPSTTPIPQMPEYFSSMANVRGEVYGILDLGLFFNDQKNELEFNYLLILNHEEYQVAISLNEVPNTIKVNESMIEDLSSSNFGSIKGKKYLTGIVKKDNQMIIMFDVIGIISGEKFTRVFAAD